jgi:hypothetical protein
MTSARYTASTATLVYPTAAARAVYIKLSASLGGFELCPAQCVAVSRCSVGSLCTSRQ